MSSNSPFGDSKLAPFYKNVLTLLVERKIWYSKCSKYKCVHTHTSTCACIGLFYYLWIHFLMKRNPCHVFLIIILTHFHRYLSCNYSYCVRTGIFFKFSLSLCLWIFVYSSVCLCLCVVFSTSEPKWELLFAIRDVSHRYGTMPQLPLVSSQPQTISIHLPLHARTNQNHAPRDNREIPRWFRGNVSAALLRKTVNMEFWIIRDIMYKSFTNK